MISRRLSTLVTLGLMTILAGWLWFPDGPPASTVASRWPARGLVLCLTPTQDPDQLLHDAQPLLNHLQARLAIAVSLRLVTDYNSIVTALAAAHADVAFMPALPAVMAMERADCIPLCIEVQRGLTHYESHIYVRADSPLQTLGDLRGHSIAFTDPVSSSGFLYPVSLFFESGLLQPGKNLESFFGKVYWAGSYESALMAMFNGHVEASCGSQHAPSWYLDEKQRGEIRLLARSEPLPTHGVFARRALGSASLAALKAALLELNDESHMPILRHLYHAEGLEPATETTYASVRKKIKATGLYREAFYDDGN